MRKKLFFLLCLGFAFGWGLSLQFPIGKKHEIGSFIEKDTLIYKNVDDLRVQTKNGNIEAYKYLKKYFQGKDHSEEIFYYALVMADKYHEYTACNDVCNSIRSIFKKYNLGGYDTETRDIISYYQNKSDSIILKEK